MPTPLEALRAKNKEVTQSSQTPLERLRLSQKTTTELTPLQKLRQTQPAETSIVDKIKGFFTRKEPTVTPEVIKPVVETPLQKLRATKPVVTQAPVIETDYTKSKGYSQLLANEITHGKGNWKPNPVTQKLEYTSPRLEKWKTATETERGKIIEEQFDESLLGKALQSETGKKITGKIESAVEDLPLKVIASVKAIGSDTYNQAYDKLKLAKGDVNNSGFQKLMYGAQDALGKVIVGVGLNMIPYVGSAASKGYWAGLSIEGQRDEQGNVKPNVVGNTTIDVIGDSILGDSLSKLLGKSASGIKNTILNTIKSTGKTALTEGSTEVTQRFLTFGNDYRLARTPEEKQTILDQAKNYVKSGDMAMEFGVGAIAGGAIGGPSSLIINKQLPKAQSTSAPVQEPEDLATQNILQEEPVATEDVTPIVQEKVETKPIDQTIFNRIVNTAEQTDTPLAGPKGSIVADLDFKRDTEIALKEVENNYNQALEIARGKVQTPIQIKKPLLIEAIAQKAAKDGDFDLASEMILLRLEAGSQAGSDLKAHDVQVGFTDPITALEVVVRQQNNRRIKGRKVSDIKKEYSKEFDKKVSKKEITQEDIISFIDEIEC